MKIIPLVILVVGCGGQVVTPELVAPKAATVSKIDPKESDLDHRVHANVLQSELRKLTFRASELLSAIFDNEWSIAARDPAQKPSLDASTTELRKELSSLETRIDAKRSELAQIRKKFPELEDANRHEAMILRQKITEMEARDRVREKAAERLRKAYDALLVEIRKSGLSEEEKAAELEELREQEDEGFESHRDHARLKVEINQAKLTLKALE